MEDLLVHVQKNQTNKPSRHFAIWFSGHVVFDQGLGFMILEVFPNFK